MHFHGTSIFFVSWLHLVVYRLVILRMGTVAIGVELASSNALRFAVFSIKCDLVAHAQIIFLSGTLLSERPPIPGLLRDLTRLDFNAI